jgi:hypothetical protein
MIIVVFFSEEFQEFNRQTLQIPIGRSVIFPISCQQIREAEAFRKGEWNARIGGNRRISGTP